ncbi:hypothetical protein GCM10023189_46610 [Nibrella saemangeumensis]|uniref:Uncharacterized protein n=1 Tax=Nibrella saemangeumensis TaxID=1084526 RepID=A0ABP8NH04_9BACT
MYISTFFIKKHPYRTPACWVKGVNLLFLVGLGIGWTGCSQHLQSNNASNRGERLEVKIGEIKEVALPGIIVNPVELIGTSENKEIVEVSRRRLTAPVDTLKPSDSGPSVFEIKGITTGTARVTFSEKRTDGKGREKIRKAYVVKVVPN